MKPDRMIKWFRPCHSGGIVNCKDLTMIRHTVLEPFELLAEILTTEIESGPERTAALRKLLEAKDAAVRAKLHPGG